MFSKVASCSFFVSVRRPEFFFYGICLRRSSLSNCYPIGRARMKIFHLFLDRCSHRQQLQVSGVLHKLDLYFISYWNKYILKKLMPLDTLIRFRSFRYVIYLRQKSFMRYGVVASFLRRNERFCKRLDPFWGLLVSKIEWGIETVLEFLVKKLHSHDAGIWTLRCLWDENNHEVSFFMILQKSGVKKHPVLSETSESFICLFFFIGKS